MKKSQPGKNPAPKNSPKNGVKFLRRVLVVCKKTKVPYAFFKQPSSRRDSWRTAKCSQSVLSKKRVKFLHGLFPQFRSQIDLENRPKLASFKIKRIKQAFSLLSAISLCSKKHLIRKREEACLISFDFLPRQKTILPTLVFST